VPVSARILLLFALSVICGCSTVPHRSETGDDRGAGIARAAARLIGTPYHFGGADADGFDCSGLVAYAHEQVGLSVPRTANEQMHAAHPVPLDAVSPGDVVFFRTRVHAGNHIDHVGIYAGGGRFIHAPRSGGTVRYASLKDGYYRKHLVSAGRFWTSR
jgi:murein DD-endopeptidase